MPIELPADLVAAMDDIDYVGSFQRLTDLHQVIDQFGPSIPRLMQQGWMQLSLGDHEAASKTAGRVVGAQPMNAEAVYLQGEAFLRAALVKMGTLVPGPGHRPTEGGAEEMLKNAQDAFDAVLRLTPTDAQAASRLALVAALLYEPEMVVEPRSRPPRPKRSARRGSGETDDESGPF